MSFDTLLESKKGSSNAKVKAIESYELSAL